jgi:hypothetical protein
MFDLSSLTNNTKDFLKMNKQTSESKDERKKKINKLLEEDNNSRNYWKKFFKDVFTKAIFILVIMFLGSNFIWFTNLSEKPQYNDKFSLDKLFPSDLNKDKKCSNDNEELMKDPSLQPCENDFYANITQTSGKGKYKPGDYSCRKNNNKFKTKDEKDKNVNSVENGLDSIMMSDGGFPYNFLTPNTYRDLNRDESFLNPKYKENFHFFFIDIKKNYINAVAMAIWNWTPYKLAAAHAGFEVLKGITGLWLLIPKLFILIPYYLIVACIFMICCVINWRGFLNWLITSIGQSYTWQRALLKAILKIHMPSPNIQDNTKVLAKEPVRIILSVIYLALSLAIIPILSNVINFIALFWRNKVWAIVGLMIGFTLSIPGILTAIQGLQFLGTFFIVPLLLDSKGVADILLCNRNIFILLYGLFIVLAAYKFLKPTLYISMIIVYLIYVIKTLVDYFRK